jgi:hypothetical protein
MEQMKKISSANLRDAITINQDPLGKISILGPIRLQTFLHHVSQVCDHLRREVKNCTLWRPEMPTNLLFRLLDAHTRRILAESKVYTCHDRGDGWCSLHG